jgi:peptidyl-tRNA hydrolase, PTH2 family
MKQVIIVRQDLKLPKGKLAAQAAHASVACYAKTGVFKRKKWMALGMKKVVLKVEGLDELRLYSEKAKRAGLVNAMIADAGKTVVEKGTITCMGIGPDIDNKVDEITGELKML